MTSTTVGGLNRFVAGEQEAPLSTPAAHALFARAAAAMTSCTTSSIRSSQSQTAASNMGVAFANSSSFMPFLPGIFPTLSRNTTARSAFC